MCGRRCPVLSAELRLQTNNNVAVSIGASTRTIWRVNVGTGRLTCQVQNYPMDLSPASRDLRPEYAWS